MHFEFFGAPTEFRRFWLVHENAKVDMCLKDPGYETNLMILADLKRFVEVWRGFREMSTELKAGHIRLKGPKHLCKDFPNWLLLSALSPYPRKVKGREQRLYSKSANLIN